MAEVKVTVEYGDLRYGGRFDTDLTDSYEIGALTEAVIELLTTEEEGFRPLAKDEEL